MINITNYSILKLILIYNLYIVVLYIIQKYNIYIALLPNKNN